MSDSKNLVLDLSFMAPAAMSGMFTDAYRFHQINVTQVFDASFPNAFGGAPFWQANRPPPIVVSRQPPTRFHRKSSKEWAGPLLQHRDKVRDVKIFAPMPTTDRSKAMKMGTLLKSLGLSIEFLSQEKIDEMIGENGARDYLESGRVDKEIMRIHYDSLPY